MILNLKNRLSDVGNLPVFPLYLPSSEWIKATKAYLRVTCDGVGSRARSRKRRNA